jgi:predicted amidophosphoribosyltransferase
MPLASLLSPPLCWGCNGVARRGEPLCTTCRGSLHRLPPEPVWLSGVRVWAPLAYGGPTRDLVRALKFRGAMGLADAMAAQMAANAPPGWLDAESAPVDRLDRLDSSEPPEPPEPPDPLESLESLARATLVPVPLHPRRLRSRGYNQAAAIANALARRAGLPVADCLARSGPSLTQVGRDRAERRAGPAGAIHVRAPRAPPRVVLVDDVVTTGATLAACRAALVAAGALEVAAVVFARTLGR